MGWGGFASGLALGVNAGRGIMDSYERGVRAGVEERERKQLEEIRNAAKAGWESGDFKGYGVLDPEMTRDVGNVPDEGAKMTRAKAQEAPTSDYGPGDAPNVPAAEGVAKNAEGQSVTTPGLQPLGVPQQLAALPKRERTDEERYIDAMRHGEQKAMALGRPELADEYFKRGFVARHRLRQDAFNKAESEAQATGDVNAYVPFFNRFVNNGIQIDRVEKTVVDGAEAYVVHGKDSDGKPLPQTPLSKDEFDRRVKMVLDPAAVRAAEAQRAEKIFEKKLELMGKPLKDQVLEMDPTKSYAISVDGKLKPIAQGSRYEKIKTKHPDGTETESLHVITNDGRTHKVVEVGFPGQDDDGKMTKVERDDVWTKAKTNLLDAVRIAAGNIPDSKQGDLYKEATGMMGDLIVANRTNENGISGDPGAIAKAAAEIVAGKAVPFKVKTETGRELDAVKLTDGRIVYTKPQQTRGAAAQANQRAAANAQPPGQPPYRGAAASGRPEGAPAPQGAAPGQANFPRVDPATQRARDGDRVKLLEDELAAEQAKPDSPQKAANVAALQREIAIVRPKAGGQAPAVSPTPAPAAVAPPATAPAPAATAVPAPAPKASPQAALTPIATNTTADANSSAQAQQVREEAIGQQLDNAKTLVKAARDKLYSYGVKQKRADPSGFEKAKAEYEAARELLRKAEEAWMPIAQRQMGPSRTVGLERVPQKTASR